MKIKGKQGGVEQGRGNSEVEKNDNSLSRRILYESKEGANQISDYSPFCNMIIYT